nr:MAG TPA: hypothetical protein [Crassvirales sp.]DAW89358.1 MAG TPA: hypothetical protein [Caudoviricetes sp.]
MLYNTPAIFIINLISGYIADQSYIPLVLLSYLFVFLIHRQPLSFT